MKWYQNLKVAFKVIIAFALVIGIAAFIGIYGRVNLRNTRIAYTEAFENYGNAQGYIGYVINAFEEEYIAMADIILYDTPEDTAECLATMDDVSGTMQVYLAMYRETCVTPEKIAEYGEIEKSLDIFHGMLAEYRQMAEAGDMKGCRELFTSDFMDETSIALTDLLFGAQESTVEEGQLILQQRDARTRQIENVMLVVMCVALLVCLVCVYFVSTSISRPLNAISAAADQLAAGDTNVQVEQYIGKDETGRTAQAFDGVARAIKALSADTRALSAAAMQGELSKRADAQNHQGEYREIVEGINGTLDAVVAPVQVAAGVLREMEQGNLHLQVEGEYAGDHAMIQHALNNTIMSIQGYIDEIKSVLSAMALGDLSVSITSDFQGDFMELKNAINNIGFSLNDVLQGINEASEQVAIGSAQVSDGATAVSQGVMEQSSSIVELTNAVSEISDQIQATTDHAIRMQKQSTQAEAYAEEGSSQMQNMQNAMDEISTASDNIARIIKAIDDIAFQTNILSLNAAVEAARAGVHGKGFAVVAEEVRNLAGKSAQAAKDTSALIQSTIEKTQAGAGIADQTAEELQRIVNAVQDAGATVEEITVASGQQAQGIAQVNQGIDRMNQVVQGNSATAEQTAAAAEELSGQAALLKQMVARFRLRESKTQSYQRHA